MRAGNPLIIPPNNLVEEAIASAKHIYDFTAFDSLLPALSQRFDDQPGFAHYADPPRPDQVVHQTFCGT